jgi:hypothetical protein
MNKTIRLRITHPTKLSGPIEGFQHLWAFYVRGFNPADHCQDCFIGELAPNFKTGHTPGGVVIEFNRMEGFHSLYICGVGKGKIDERYRTNFHFPLKYQEGETTNKKTENDYLFIAENAVELPIPSLPDDWLPREYARCKNFQFGVEYFGADGTGARHQR